LKPTRIAIALALLIACCAFAEAKPRTLDIYFIDVEGGAATLIVTPQGASLLVDSGFPGERDAARIAHVARDIAGLNQIDHYITTHWHRDHVGGSSRLAELIPIRKFYDHGLPTALATDIQPELIQAYRQTTKGQSIVLKPLDEIKFNDRSLRLKVVASGGVVVGEPANAPQIKPCGAAVSTMPEDKTDNANSIGFVLSFGNFRFFDGGDLTWNVEQKLVCPQDLVGPVDVYQVDHHGADSSNNPLLIKALRPTVAIIDNGARKAGEPRTFATLKSQREIQAIYQLHRNLATTAQDNAPPDFVANDEEACQGNFIKISAEANGNFSVSIPAKGITRNYKAMRR